MWQICCFTPMTKIHLAQSKIKRAEVGVEGRDEGRRSCCVSTELLLAAAGSAPLQLKARLVSENTNHWAFSIVDAPQRRHFSLLKTQEVSSLLGSRTCGAF